MKLEDLDISDIDFNSLDFQEIGTWPLLLRIGVLILSIVVFIGGGYHFMVSKNITELNTNVQKQKKSRQDLKTKYNQASNLDAYRDQMKSMRITYKRLLRQLPSEGQIASLLEDMSRIAVASKLEYKTIKPGEAVSRGFYMELPISLVLRGEYHNFGVFASKISALSRIVTLHDFSIIEDSESDEEQLLFSVDAKTYWIAEASES